MRRNSERESLALPLLLCSEGRHVKHMGMHMYSADACGRNEGDDVCSAQAETIDNCQTTTDLLSTRKLEMFFFFSEAPNIAKFVHIFFRGNEKEILCVPCQTTLAVL